MTTVIDRGATNGVLPAPQAIKDAEYAGIIGYSSDFPSKNMLRPYVERASEVGILVNNVWENGQGDLLHGTPDQLKAMGARYEAQSNALGKPADAWNILTVDTDAGMETWATIAGNLDLVRSQLSRPVTVLYGPMALTVTLRRDGHCQEIWVPYAWGHNDNGSGASVDQARFVGAALYQRLQGAAVDAATVDVDDVLKPTWGGWNLSGSVVAQAVAPTVSTVASGADPAPVVDVLVTPGGSWVLRADGAVETAYGSFYGSYFSLPGEQRQDTAPFVAITERIDGRTGYTLWNNLGHHFDLGG
jgi:hypothetical protein